MRELAERHDLVLRFPRFSLIRNCGDWLDDDEINRDGDVNDDDDDDDGEENDHYKR